MGAHPQGMAPKPDNSKAIIVKDLNSVNNFLVFEGNKAEQFALEVARELVANATPDQVHDAIHSVMRRKV